MLVPVILAGGIGSRLWPLSQADFPKQLLRLNSLHTLFQQTLSRLDKDIMTSPIVVTNKSYQAAITAQLKDVSITPSHVLLEPVRRGTAPAIALAAMAALEEDSKAVLLVLPADHIIKNVSAFHQSLILAYEMAQEERFVLLGVKPDRAATQYGYIRQGDALIKNKAYVVQDFVEKPDEVTASRYLQSGDYLWNSGMFILSAAKYLEVLRELAPEIYSACAKAFEKSVQQDGVYAIDQAAFEQSPDDSVDYAVFEKTDQSVVLPLDIEWHDIGTWESLYRAMDKDAQGNVVLGEALCSNCVDSIVIVDEPMTVNDLKAEVFVCFKGEAFRRARFK